MVTYTVKVLRFLYMAILASGMAMQALCAVDSTAAKSAFQFLEASTTPVGIAMGNAGVALPGAGFTYYNPARPYGTDAPSLALGYGPQPGDLTAWFGEGVLNFSNSFLGLHLSNHSVSGIYTADETGPKMDPPFSAGFTLLSVDAGYMFNRGAIAMTLNGMQDRIETSTAYGVSASFGGVYSLIAERLTVGAALMHIGTTTGYTDATQNWGEGDPLPRTARLGVAYCDVWKRIPFSADLDIIYRDVGDKLTRAKNALPRITVPMGLEVRPNDYVAIRVGKRFNYETELVSFGAGARFRPLSFDMSFVLSQLIDAVEVQPMFALTYAIGSGSAIKRGGPIVASEVPVRSGDTVRSSTVNSLAPSPSDSGAQGARMPKPAGAQNLQNASPSAADSSAHGDKPPYAAADSISGAPSKPQNSNLQAPKELPAKPQMDMKTKPQDVDSKVENPAPEKQ